MPTYNIQLLCIFINHHITSYHIILHHITSHHRSESEVNTERIVSKSSGISHVEGGWAKEIDPLEPSDTTRFRKKTEKDDDFKNALRVMAPIITRCLRQNNTINIYEVYSILYYYTIIIINYSISCTTTRNISKRQKEIIIIIHTSTIQVNLRLLKGWLCSKIL